MLELAEVKFRREADVSLLSQLASLQRSGIADVTITQPNRGKLPSLSIMENPEVKF
jgi:hypothetical protein